MAPACGYVCRLTGMLSTSIRQSEPRSSAFGRWKSSLSGLLRSPIIGGKRRIPSTKRARRAARVRFLQSIARLVRGRGVSFLTSAPRLLSNSGPNPQKRTVNRLFRDKSVELKIELPDSVPTIIADRDRLFQVVVNLLSNAVKFSPRDAGLVTLGVETDTDGVMLSVTDNGPGIAAKDRDAIFERFRQVGDTLTAKPEGSGLGLAISRMIIEHFGGRAWVEEAPGGGAIFRGWLPREPAAASAA